MVHTDHNEELVERLKLVLASLLEWFYLTDEDNLEQDMSSQEWDLPDECLVDHKHRDSHQDTAHHEEDRLDEHSLTLWEVEVVVEGFEASHELLALNIFVVVIDERSQHDWESNHD